MNAKILDKLFSMPSQASIPGQFLSNTISAMRDGDIGWTVPWGMWVDENDKCWLNGNYTIREETGGTVQMRVEKRDGKFFVDIHCCRDHGWSEGKPHYVGDNENHIPVAKLII